jgi:CRP-like cAMP-binding protein
VHIEAVFSASKVIMPTNAENHLIELLPRVAQRRLLALCEPVQLAWTQVLFEPGEVLRHVIFPVDSFVSLRVVIDGHRELEVGMVGREGMLGAHFALGVYAAPVRAVVLGPGAAWRINAAVFRRELQDGSALSLLLRHYLYVQCAQLCTGVACQHYHLIGARLARWLLMSQDRVHNNHFHVTHELMAGVLGVRRVGVTAAAVALQRGGAIQYHRGNLEVLDRGLLEQAACGCYVSDLAAYHQQLG